LFAIEKAKQDREASKKKEEFDERPNFIFH
jgi:hypothetical protein